jgi:hypothetical protein
MSGFQQVITSKDGSDANYRMVIEDQYKEMAKMRRNLKISMKVQTIYVLVRTAWKCAPSLIQGKNIN